MIRGRKLIWLLSILGLVYTASAQDADDYRGGWRTDGGEASGLCPTRLPVRASPVPRSSLETCHRLYPGKVQPPFRSRLLSFAFAVT